MKRLLSCLLSYIPTALPTGIPEFEVWAAKIIALLPKGLDSVPENDKKFVLASAIQHLPQARARVPNRYFINLLHKAAASQVASQVFLNVKEAQRIAEEAKKLAEATANLEVISGKEEAP